MSIKINMRLRAIAGLAACACLASAAQAQFSELTDPPAPPTDLAPASGNPARDCVRNVNDPALAGDPTLVVIGKDGSRTPITMVKRKNGLYAGPEVAGISRLGSVSVAKSYSTVNPSFVRQELTSRGVGVVDFAIPVSPVIQRTFVAIHTIDTGGAIREFNENDNVVAKCRKR